jgi:hypothetical protein
MSKLDRFIEAEQLSMNEVLAEGDGPQPGDLVGHVDFADFRGRVTAVDNGHCRVKVLDGWKGPAPGRPVPIPTAKLEVLS